MVLCCLVFVLDISTPTEMAIYIAYIPLIFCDQWFKRRQISFLFATVASALIIIAFFVEPLDSIETRLEVVNRLLALLVLWIIAVLVFRIGIAKQINEAKWRLASVVESSDDAIITKTLDGIITSWNRGATEMFGYNSAEAVGRYIGFLIPKNRQAEETQIINEIKKNQRIDHYETVRIDKKGRCLDISLSISPILDERGNVIGASKIARDISGRKAAEKALKTSEQRYSLAVQGLSVGIWDWNVATNQLYWSPRFKKILGVPDDGKEMQYTDFTSRLHPDDRARPWPADRAY